MGAPSAAEAVDAARCIVGAAVAALRIATERWLAGGGASDPVMLLDDLIVALRTA